MDTTPANHDDAVRFIDNALSHLKNITPSRENSLAITKLEEAKLWIGQDVKVREIAAQP